MIARLPELLPEVRLEARCYTCRRYHPIHAGPHEFAARCAEWEVKHRGHRIEFVSRERRLPARIGAAWKALERVWSRFNVAPWWLEWRSNADIKIAYAASADYTITLASLATSATLVAGAEGTAVSNTTNKYLDYLVGGKITTGTSPTTGKSIEVWAYAAFNDTPTYPDVFDGTASAETVTSADIKAAVLGLLASLPTDATSDRPYPFRPTSLAARFDFICPTHHGPFCTHDTAVNLNSTAGNHVISYTPVYLTSA